MHTTPARTTDSTSVSKEDAIDDATSLSPHRKNLRPNEKRNRSREEEDAVDEATIITQVEQEVAPVDVLIFQHSTFSFQYRSLFREDFTKIGLFLYRIGCSTVRTVLYVATVPSPHTEIHEFVYRYRYTPLLCLGWQSLSLCS
jgi:hypothetical protein